MIKLYETKRRDEKQVCEKDKTQEEEDTGAKAESEQVEETGNDEEV